MKVLKVQQKNAAINSENLLEYYGKTNNNIELLSKQIFEYIVNFLFTVMIIG